MLEFKEIPAPTETTFAVTQDTSLACQKRRFAVEGRYAR